MKFKLQSLAIDIQEGNPDQRPFIFLHGNTQNDTCGKGIKEYFKERGHLTLSYDMPGHGNSQLDTSDYKFEDLIDLNFQILKHFKIQQPILCGHSLGGMIQAGTIAKFQVSDASLILCGSFDSNPVLESRKQDNDQSQIAQLLEEYMAEGRMLFKKQFKYDYFANLEVPDEELRIVNRQFTIPDANESNLKYLGDFSARKNLIHMNIPVLVLHGEEETVIPKPLVETMASQYKNIEIGWYSGKGHYAFYQDSELTNKFLSQYYSFLIREEN